MTKTLLTVLAVFFMPALALPSGEHISWYVISSGGATTLSSPNFQIGCTVGQVAAGSSSSTNYQLLHGFWQEEEMSESCCSGGVGDANASGEDEPTIGDINALISAIYTDQLPDAIVSGRFHDYGYQPVD